MANIPLIPVNDNLVRQAEETAQKNRMFNSIDQFITMYNLEMLNPNNESIKNMATLIENAYKNVEHNNKKLIVVFPSEIACQNIIKLIEDWKMLVNLKRIAITMFDEGSHPESKIVFKKGKTGIPLNEFVKDDGELELEPHWTKEKIAKTHEDIVNNIFVKRMIQPYDEEGNVYFKIEDLVDIDDAFILDIEKALLNRSFITANKQQ